MDLNNIPAVIPTVRSQRVPKIKPHPLHFKEKEPKGKREKALFKLRLIHPLHLKLSYSCLKVSYLSSHELCVQIHRLIGRQETDLLGESCFRKAEFW